MCRSSGYGVLYPVLISPAYALFDSLTDAYAAVKVINSLAMSLAAIPTYLIARRVAGHVARLLAALLAVALPSLVYTATVMTENLYYPLALVVMWATLVALARPTWRNTVLVFVALGTRARDPHPGGRARGRDRLRTGRARGRRGEPVRPGPRRPGACMRCSAEPSRVVAGGSTARGQSLSGLLGAYGVVGDRSYDLGTVLRYWLWHAEELTLYLGVVPVAATLVLLGAGRDGSRSGCRSTSRSPSRSRSGRRSSLRRSPPSSPAGSRSATCSRSPRCSSSPSSPGSRSGRRVRWPRVAVATGAGRRCSSSRSRTRAFIDEPAKSDTLAILPIWSAFGHLPFGSIWFSVLLGALALAALFLLVPARWAVVVPLAVLLWFGVVGASVWSGPQGFVQAGAGALFQGIRGAPRDWIDAALPPGAKTGIVWTGLTDRFTVNQNEFFNRAVGPVYYTERPTPGNLPGDRRSRVDPERTGSCDARTGRRSPTATSSPTPRSSSTARRWRGTFRSG